MSGTPHATSGPKRTSDPTCAQARPVPGAIPHYRSIIGVDIRRSTERTNTQRGTLRKVMYDLVTEAVQTSGISDRHTDDLMDRGDGLFVYVHPVDTVPKPLLITTVIPVLSGLLAQYNHRHPQDALRMRAVVHAGEIHFDGRGWFGEAVDVACRLLDAPGLRKQFEKNDANLILVVSDEFYRTVVRHDYDGINGHDFERLVRVRVGDDTHWGWVSIPEATMIPQQLRGVPDLESRRWRSGEMS